MVEERCHPTLHATNERPPDVRRSRTDLRARVNGDLQLEFADVALTSYAGLELFGQYLRATGFNATVRAACAGTAGWGDFGAVAMVRLRDRAAGRRAAGGCGTSRIVQDDPLFQRFCEVQVVPTARTVSRWLQGFTMTTVARLQAINTAVIARVLADAGRAHVDDRCRRGRGVDGPAGRARLPRFQSASPEGAELLPDHGAPGRDDPRAAREESIGQRPRRESGAAAFCATCGRSWARCCRAAARSGFAWMARFSARMCCSGSGARPPATPSRCPSIAGSTCSSTSGRSRRGGAVAPGITGFVVPAAATPWGRPLWVAIYRKHVHHPATKNYQLDLFDPDDGHYEYSAVTSNLDFTAREPLAVCLRAAATTRRRSRS